MNFRTRPSPELAASLGITPTPEGAAPVLIPADQVKPEDIATPWIEYRDGQPVIVATGGRFIPQGIRLADSDLDFTAALAGLDPLTDVSLLVLPDIGMIDSLEL
ncbi:hypothetical protein Sros01_78820 [Streptomyces roseochromogenus]|nr:hypothetical protein Sros01_78820 [Streptomyces roseochromogenus]